MKSVAVIGSTGTIGKNTLKIINAHSDKFSVNLLVANTNAKLLIEQALHHRPQSVVIASSEAYQDVKDALSPHNISVHSGHPAISDEIIANSPDIVIIAIVGFAALTPTLAAISLGKRVGLANKEALVVAGEQVMTQAAHYNTTLVPIDSEHSAIFQCLSRGNLKRLKKIILTASGGPFRNKSIEDLKRVTVADALKHPNWVMGEKITIDSATMMNKGLEIIEAKWLFNLQSSQIDVTIHPQSIIHSMVEYVDHSIIAQMGLPDMQIPIQYALTWPDRLEGHYPSFDFSKPHTLTFQPVDMQKYKSISLAYAALEKGGSAPCTLNGANEVAVSAFLKGNLSFLDILNVIEQTIHMAPHISSPAIEDYYAIDKETRRIAVTISKNL